MSKSLVYREVERQAVASIQVSLSPNGATEPWSILIWGGDEKTLE